MKVVRKVVRYIKAAGNPNDANMWKESNGTNGIYRLIGDNGAGGLTHLPSALLSQRTWYANP
jgi:hypothetical protein